MPPILIHFICSDIKRKITYLTLPRQLLISDQKFHRHNSLQFVNFDVAQGPFSRPLNFNEQTQVGDSNANPSSLQLVGSFYLFSIFYLSHSLALAEIYSVFNDPFCNYLYHNSSFERLGYTSNYQSTSSHMESIVGTKVKIEFSLKVVLSYNTFHTMIRQF